MGTTPQVLFTIFLIQFFILLGCGEGQQLKALVVSSTRLKNPGWRPGDNTHLVSPNGRFCAGFYNFSPNNYAFAVWYANDPQRTVAWIANRDDLVGHNSSLTLENENLTLSDSDAQGRIWTAPINTSNGTDAEMGLVLLDSGNLVFNTSTNNYVWQSFDSPTFTLLPTQKFSQTSRLVSTKNDSTSSSGVYLFASQTNSQTPSLYYNRSELESDQLDLYWSNAAFSLGLDGNLSLNEDGWNVEEEEVVDKNILSKVKNDGLQMEAIRRMVKTAFWCIQSRPDERPSMGKVAKMLQGTLEVQQPPKPNFFANFLHADSSEFGDRIHGLRPPPPII